jgi:hypothetical protein
MEKFTPAAGLRCHRSSDNDFARDLGLTTRDPVLLSSDTLNVSQEALVRRNHFLAAVLVVLTFTSLVFGLDLTGKWTGKSGDGYPLVLTLKSEAAQVSGTMLAADGKTECPLKDVKLDEDMLSFTVDSEWQGSTVKLIAKAKVAADQIQLHIETDNGYWSADATLSREAKP